jgi:hypothetical protein
MLNRCRGKGVMPETRRKAKKTIYTRGAAAEAPNWMFGLSARIPREALPTLCEGLAFFVRERSGGCYYYPDYTNRRMAAAFEWYVPYQGRKFGYKLGVEFWIEAGDLAQIGAYVLYGEDHPKRGQPPDFDSYEQKRLQRKVIEAVELSTSWRTQLPEQQFHTVRFLQLHSRGFLKTPLEIPTLDLLVLPTVLLGKHNARVSAVIQTVSARFREEAKETSVRRFSKLCALLTLATGEHCEPYVSTLGRTPLKQFVDRVCPPPSIPEVYPRGKYKNYQGDGDTSVWNSLNLLSSQYSSLGAELQTELDQSIFAYYTAKELLKKFRTIATVALVAALKLFRQVAKCDGSIACSKCGSLSFRHDTKGEARSIADSLCEKFGFAAGDGKRAEVLGLVSHVYKAHRSGYVHDAILRHGEFGTEPPAHVPDERAAISERLTRKNELMTIDLLTRRALLQHIASLAGKQFDSAAYGIEVERFKFTLGSAGHFVVGSKYWVGVRAMGAIQ